MQTKALLVAFAATLALLGCSTDGGESQANALKPGSPEWFLDATVMNVERGDFVKALEHLENATKGEGPGAERAVVWRTVMTAGLALGHREAAEACKEGIEAKPDSAANLRGPLQQAQRDSRQYTIELVEGLGDFEKVLAKGQVTLDFPFPTGATNESPVMAGIAGGDAVPEQQLADGIAHTLRRHQILSVAEMAGVPGDANAAQAKFDAGPVSVSEDHARITVVRYLADISPMFDTQMLNDPKIRKIVLDRADQWIAPYLESEDEDQKAAAEELKEIIEDERRDMGGSRRRLDRR